MEDGRKEGGGGGGGGEEEEGSERHILTYVEVMFNH